MQPVGAGEIPSESLCLALEKSSTIVSSRGCDTAAVAGQLGDTCKCEVLCEEDVSLIPSWSHEYARTSIGGELEQ